jgi:hypothetical protein
MLKMVVSMAEVAVVVVVYPFEALSCPTGSNRYLAVSSRLQTMVVFECSVLANLKINRKKEFISNRSFVH